MKFIILAAFSFLLFSTTHVLAVETDSEIIKYDKKIETLKKNIVKLQQQLVEQIELRKKRLAKLNKSSEGNAKTLSSFESAGKTWSTLYNTQSVPTDGYAAYYFDTTNPGKILKTSLVDSVDINYPWDSGQGFKIPSENFGGYWIGEFSLKKTQEMTLYISQSWSNTRVIIDGKLIYQGDSNSVSKVTVPKGEHTIEIEYTNNWHTTGFSASLIPTEEALVEVPNGYLAGLNIDEIWFGGVYESSAFDKTIKLKMQGGNNSSKILLLSSYDVVKWDMSGLRNSGIKTVVVSSYSPGSLVTNVPSGVSVYSSSKFPYVYESDKVYSTVMSQFGKPKNIGFAGSYSADELSFPGKFINSAN